MSISDLFDSEFKARNKGHFSAIVRVALADGDFSTEEKEFLDKLAIQLEISREEYDEILKNLTNTLSIHHIFIPKDWKDCMICLEWCMLTIYWDQNKKKF
jgi:hypothetical protein